MEQQSSAERRDRSATDPQPSQLQLQQQQQQQQFDKSDLKPSFSKLDELLAKRPAVPRQHIEQMKLNLSPNKAKADLEAITLKLKAGGNEKLLQEMMDRERQLKQFEQRAKMVSKQVQRQQQQQQQQFHIQGSQKRVVSEHSQTKLELSPEVRRRLEIMASPTARVIPAKYKPGLPTSSDTADTPNQAQNGDLSSDNQQQQQQQEAAPISNSLNLNTMWQVFYDRRGLTVKPSAHSNNYESILVSLFQFDTIPTFWAYFSYMKPASQQEYTSNIHIFRHGIKPLWEDAANEHGGKWSVNMPPELSHLTDDAWTRCVLAVIGESLNQNNLITGAVFSRRQKADRIAIWLGQKRDKNAVLDIGAKLLEALNLHNVKGVGMEFTPHSENDVPSGGGRHGSSRGGRGAGGDRQSSAADFAMQDVKKRMSLKDLNQSSNV